jgi:thymidylate kinase
MNKPNLYILEGPDCCGKTTLAKKFAQERHAFYFHSTATPKLFSALDDYHKNIIENVHTNQALGFSVILDRFWPSEVAYGKVFRPESGYDFERIAELTDECNPLYVFCFAKGAWARYAQGHTDPAHSLTKEQFFQVAENYKKIYASLQSLGAKVISYVMEEDGKDEESLKSYMNQMQIWAK